MAQQQWESSTRTTHEKGASGRPRNGPNAERGVWLCSRCGQSSWLRPKRWRLSRRWTPPKATSFNKRRSWLSLAMSSPHSCRRRCARTRWCLGLVRHRVLRRRIHKARGPAVAGPLLTQCRPGRLPSFGFGPGIGVLILLLRHCSIDSGISGGGSERSTGILSDVPAAGGGVKPPGGVVGPHCLISSAATSKACRTSTSRSSMSRLGVLTMRALSNWLAMWSCVSWRIGPSFRW